MIELEGDIDPLRRLTIQDFSYSRLSTFGDCGTRYFYSYIVKVPQSFGHPATLGNIIHEALEYTLESNQTINLMELLQNYKAARQNYDPSYEIPDQMISNGEAMLREFVVDNEAPTNIYAKELPFSFVLGRARFNGFIDRVDVYEDYVHCIDYKSGAREVAKKDIPFNLQLGIYALYLKHLFPDKQIYAELYYLKSKRRKGHFFTEDDLSRIESDLIDKVNTVLNTGNFKATPNERACDWCSYAKDGTCPTGQLRLRRRGLIE